MKTLLQNLKFLTVLLVLLASGTTLAQTNYYYKGTGNINAVASWGTNTNGTGTAPTNFTSANRIFNLRNSASPTLNGSWTVSGNNSKVVVGDGTNACNFTVGSNFVLNATVDVSANATLTLSTTGSITSIAMGTLDPTSTVNFASTAAQTIPVEAYGNLTISGAKGNNDTTFAGSTNIAGNLTISATGNAGAQLIFNNSTNVRTYNVGGDYIQTGYEAEMGTNTATTSINFSGGFLKTGGYIVNTQPASNATFNFSGTTQNIQSSGGTDIKWVNFNVLNGSTCTLVGDFNYNGSSPAGTFTVNSGGTLNCSNFNLVTASATAAVFVVANGGTLEMGSSAGITSTGATGNIQSNVRTFNTGANYIYSGGGAQAAGNALPATVNSLTVTNNTVLTLPSAKAITNNFLIATGSSVNLGTGLSHTAGTLTMGGFGTPAGSHGSSTSAATNKNDTFFSAVTGIVTVGTGSCAAITAVLSGAATICSGNSTNLSVAVTGGLSTYTVVHSGGTVNTYTSGSAISVSPASTTTYSLTSVKDSNGCSATVSGTPTVTVNTLSTAPTGISGTTTICNGSSTTLTVAGGSLGTGATVQWFTGSCGGTAAGTGNSITVSPTSATTYYVRYSGTCNTTTCASQAVTVNTLSTAPTGITGVTTICNGSSTTLTVAGGSLGTGATVQWFTGSCGGTAAGTGNSITVSPTSTTTYYVRYSGTCNTTTCASQIVTVNTLSTAPTGITGVTTICNGSSTTLTVAGGSPGTGATAEWFTGSCGGTAAGTGNSITVSPTSTTTYYVRYNGTCNTTTCASQAVTVNTLSTAPTGITGVTTICNGSSTTLTVAGGSLGTGATVQWFTGSCGGTAAGTGNSITVSPTSTTTYYVRYSGTCNTTTCASQIVTVNTLSTAPTGITGVTTICNGSSTTLTVAGGSLGTGATVQWFTGSCGGTAAGTGNSITVSPTSTTTYYVRYSGTCNTTTCASQAVTVNTLSTAPTGITGVTTICNGSSTTLTVAGGSLGTGATVQWFTGSCGGTAAGTGNSITVSPTSTTTYYVRYSGTCNTTTCVSQMVNVNSRPTASVISGSATICAGSTTSIQVSITGGTSPYSLVYSGGSVGSYTSGANIPVTPSATTTYTLTSVTDANGCAGIGNSGSAVLTINSTTSVNGGPWSNGSPSAGKSVIFDGTNITLTGDLTACSLTLKNGSTVTVQSGADVTLTGALAIEAGSSIIFNNNAGLLQSIPAGTTYTNTGNAVIKRNSSALKRLDYTVWSSPVTGQGVYAFSPFTFGTRFYVYRTATNIFNNADVGLNVTNLDANGVNGTDSNNVQFSAAKGYLIRMPWDHPTTATIWNGQFMGVPHNGNINYTLTDAGAGNRFNLVGNPYPSPIDAAAFVTNTNNTSSITGTLYFWRKTNNALSPSYCTWTLGGFVSNGEAQVYDPNDVIQTGQGFFVEATGSGTVNFDNSMRVANHTNQFFKNSNTANTVIERSRIWLNATNSAGLFCQTMVGYMTGATQGVDNSIDGKYINDGDIALTSLINDLPYAIQGRALPFDASDIVPLSFKAAAAGSYSIAIDHVDGLFSAGTQQVLLKDNLTNTYHNLTTAGAYTFNTTAGTFTNRFEIVYQTTQLANPVFTQNAVVIYSQENAFVINSGNFTMSSVKVFDIRGRMIEEKKDINANQVTIRGGMANEVLLVQITTEEGATVTKKVIR